MTGQQPFVSIITPVYNGEKYLASCIESVLGQSYDNWEYIIVNNRSTDRTREIAQAYAGKDERITVVDNEAFVDVITNHNIAFRRISPDSSYCKVLQADDLLFPDCITSMVEVFEQYPEVGVVGAYSLTGKDVKCTGMEYPDNVISGREISRRVLLGELYPFWSPTSLMIRSGLIRRPSTYYEGRRLDADVDALYRDFTGCDFGFVYQVLTFIRRNPESVTAKDKSKANTQLLSHVRMLQKYGPVYLSEHEYKTRMKVLLEKYYRLLAMNVFRLQGRDFWRSQEKSLGELGRTLQKARLAKVVMSDLFFQPRRSLHLVKRALISR